MRLPQPLRRHEPDISPGIMAEEQNKKAEDDAPGGAGKWIKSHKLRTAIMGTIALTGLMVVFGLWSYVGHVAVLDEKPVTLEMALDALDQQKHEEARNLINRLQRQPGAEDFGASLFVLGAVKAHQADTEWSV